MSQFQPQDPQDKSVYLGDDAMIWGMRSNTFNLLMHLSQLLNFIPSAGIIVPIVMWALNKDNSPAVDAHGKVIINWILSLLVYGVICFILTFVLIGALGFMVLAALGIIFPIIGAVKANNGELWPYPLSINFIK